MLLSPLFLIFLTRALTELTILNLRRRERETTEFPQSEKERNQKRKAQQEKTTPRLRVSWLLTKGKMNY